MTLFVCDIFKHDFIQKELTQEGFMKIIRTSFKSKMTNYDEATGMISLNRANQHGI
jgi:hypothetical protein